MGERGGGRAVGMMEEVGSRHPWGWTLASLLPACSLSQHTKRVAGPRDFRIGENAHATQHRVAGIVAAGGAEIWRVTGGARAPSTELVENVVEVAAPRPPFDRPIHVSLVPRDAHSPSMLPGPMAGLDNRRSRRRRSARRRRRHFRTLEHTNSGSPKADLGCQIVSRS